MKGITIYDKNPNIVGYVITQTEDPKLFQEVLGSCSSAFGTNTRDKHDEDYPYLVSLYNNSTVLAGYRVMVCKNAKINNNDYNLYTREFFNYTEEFVEKILPKAAEFGRSFTSTASLMLPRAILIHSFRSIWTTSLAPFITECEKKGVNHFFGQISIPSHEYSPDAIKKMIAFFVVNFGEKKFFEPKKPLILNGAECSTDEILEMAESCGFTGIPAQDLIILKSQLGGKSMPMLLKKYPELVGWNPEAIVCNMATNSHVNTVDLPFCLNSTCFTERTRTDYFSLKDYNAQAFDQLLQQ